MILTSSEIQLTKEAEKRKSSANIAISSINFWLIQHTESCDKVEASLIVTCYMTLLVRNQLWH